MGAVSASHAADEVAVRRCPGCGRRMANSQSRRCPLCDYAFADDQATGTDVTPYAQSYATGERRRPTMTAWVWSAQTARLKHLALMRRSAASARFAHVRILLVAGGLALLHATVYGWHQVARISAVPGTVRPAGQGWFHVTDVLWWNPAQAIIAAVCAFVSAWLLLLILLALLRAGMTLAHTAAHRHERRMTAAIDYSTAWAGPVLIALAILPLRVIGVIGAASRSATYPPARVFEVVAGVIAGGGMILLWFWLIRLGAAAAEQSRGRVLLFFLLGAPLLAVGMGVGWWFGLDRAYGPLFEVLKLNF